MHTEGQALPGEILHDGLQVGKLGDERRPAVDHQEHVAERIGRRRMVRVLAHLPVRGHRPDPVLLEHAFALAQNGFHLRDNAVDPVGFGSGRDTADVRKVLEVHQAAAAEVDAVELNLPRRVRGRGRQHQRLQERRLAGLRGAADGDVAAGRRNVDAPDFLAVPAWLVHDPQAEPQRPPLVVALDEFVDRCRIGQRRQPHSVCADLPGGQLVEDHLAQHTLVGFDGHASAPTRSGPRFAAILTRARLRVVMPRLPLAPVLASLRSSLALAFGCSCLGSHSLRSSLRCDPHSRSPSGAHARSAFGSSLTLTMSPPYRRSAPQ